MSARLDILKGHIFANEYVGVVRRGVVGFLYMQYRAPRPASRASLTSSMRAALLRGLSELQDDSNIQGIVIMSDDSRIFSAGINKDSFADGIVSDVADDVPSLAQLNDAIEKSGKVVIAFVQGQCASWGLELSMAAYKCVATPNSRFSFPEVRLGLVPCGGGSLRLTRLVGVRQALKILCSGRVVRAEEAVRLGLINDVIEPSTSDATMQQLVQYVHNCIQERQQAQGEPRGRSVARLGMAASNWVHFAWMKHKIGELVPYGMKESPSFCLEAIKNAVQHGADFERGLAAEQQLFQKCLSGSLCRGTQHAMRASERTLRVWERSYTLNRSQHFNHVAVLGAGTMGSSIAYLLLQNGLRVTLVEVDAARQELLRNRMQLELTHVVQGERFLTQAQAQELASRFTLTGSHSDPYPASALADVDLVLECIPESAEMKKNVFTHLDRICKRSCVFASCSSAMDVNELAAVTQRPGQVLGLHMYPPANATVMAEVSRGVHTEMRVLRRVVGLADHLRKHVIVTRGTTGHVGTRLLLAGLYQGYAMLEDGCFPYDVDRALKKHFHAHIGIFELEDLIGLDAMALTRGVLRDMLPQRNVLDVVDGLVRDGLFGRKRGEGWYRYKQQRSENENSSAAVPVATAALNPFTWRTSALVTPGHTSMMLSIDAMHPTHNRSVEHRILQTSARKSIIRRDVSHKEVVERVLLAMINEAAQLLDAGIIACASDVDCLSVNGFGFPAWKGGLLYYADNILGIDTVIRRLQTYRRSLVEAFPPVCDALIEMQKKGLKFADAFPDKST